MTDEMDLAPVVRSWFRETLPPASESSHVFEAAIREARTKRQQRHRWPPLPLPSTRPSGRDRVHDRRACTATATDTTEYRASPIPATNGYVPNVIGRTQTMFSPVKAAVVGALVFALGGMFLIAQPFSQQGSTPGAQSTETNAVSVDVVQDCADIYASPIVCTWTASDPRLTGTLTHRWVADISAPEPDDVYGLGWADATLEGPEGNWTGHLYVVWGAEPASQLFAFLSGDGAYEGWQYVGSTIDSEESGDSPWFGVVYEGEALPYGSQPIVASD